MMRPSLSCQMVLSGLLFCSGCATAPARYVSDQIHDSLGLEHSGDELDEVRQKGLGMQDPNSPKVFGVRQNAKN